MPRLYERYYSLDLKKSAQFGPSKEVYTLRLRLISFGNVRETKNLLLTPGQDELKNYTQWISLKKILSGENVLLFSYDELRPFFPPDEMQKLIIAQSRGSLELKSICELFALGRDFYSLEDIAEWLNDLFGRKTSDDKPLPETVLDNLGKLAAGFDQTVRRSLSALLAPLYPLISEWLDSFKEQVRTLPGKIADAYPLHFIKYSERNLSADDLDQNSRIEEIFGGEGALGKVVSGYEVRPEQSRMAKLFARAVNNSEFFVAEAGTGTGKSLAYLIPSILYCAENNQRVVVATYTRTLQSQLLFNDLQIAANAVGRKFTAALLKGRSNYLCLLKLAILKSRTSAKILPEDYFSLAKLELWKSLTKSGDLSEINLENSRLVSEIAAEANFCLKQSCQYYNKCCFFKARKQASRASIVIVNQALFFTDMIGEGSILGARDIVIFDEAHRLEKTATSHLGGELDRFYPITLLKNLYNVRGPEESLINSVERMIRSLSVEDDDHRLNLIGRIKDLCETAGGNLVNLFDTINTIREKHGYRAEGFAFKLRYDTESELYHRIAPGLDDLGNSFGKLSAKLRDLYRSLKEFELTNNQEALAEELNRALGEIAGIAKNAAVFCECDSEYFVFWLEISERGFSRLSYAPIDVGTELNRSIYDKYPCILFTSASLSVEGYFDYYEKSVGLNLQPGEKIIRKSFGSSFDFLSQIGFFCPVFLPSPKSEYYSRSLAGFINYILPRLKKKTLVLCTSNQMLTDLHNQTARSLTAAGFEVLAQSVSGNAEQVLAAFKRSRLAVIFGTDSFWEGIDLPGTQLEVLLITRLPFATPGDPIEAARMERLEKAGENSFVSYSLPNAVLKFKQGFGRLIRQKSDSGFIIVTDNRLFKSSFGQIFLNSVPAELNIVYSQDEFLDKLGPHIK